jgi:hypothetical protein
MPQRGGTHAGLSPLGWRGDAGERVINGPGPATRQGDFAPISTNDQLG